MRNKYFFLIALALVLFPLVSAVQTQINLQDQTSLVIDYPKYQSVQFNTPFELNMYVYNGTDGLRVDSATCWLDIWNSTGQHALDMAIPFGSTDYTLEIAAGNFSQYQKAAYNIYCNTTDAGGFASGNLIVTASGETVSDNMEIFIWILFIIAFIGNILILIMILVKLATTRETIFGVLTSWGFYTLLIMVSFLAAYLPNNFINSSTDLLMTILVWTNGVLPLISLVVTMFVKGTKKKKPISVEELTGRVPFMKGGY